MVFEEEFSKRFNSLPDAVKSLIYALIFTGAAYLFVYFGNSLHMLPESFDLPWLLIFVAIFLVFLVRKRIKGMKQDSKPTLS